MYKLGDLKINCYKLIDPADNDMVVSEIPNYENDSTYSFYFLNMLPSINSAITRIVQACILPLKRLEIDCKKYHDDSFQEIVKEDGTTSKVRLKKKAMINLKNHADDIYKVKLIEYEDKNGNSDKIGYRLIGDYLEIANQLEGNFIIYYHPRIKSIENLALSKEIEDINQVSLNELGLDDNIISYIPYYVKADLLEQDKPSEANIARNTFEQYISSFEVPEIEVRTAHKSWWGGLL